MDTHDISDTILEAHGAIMLGHYAEAWKLLETLSFYELRSAPVLRLWIMICTGLKKWGTGVELCTFLRLSQAPEHREAMGRFYLAYAEDVCPQGNVDLARKWIGAMSTVWPEGWEAARRSKALEALWG